MLSLRGILGIAALCFDVSRALPAIGFPVNAQFPPVAVLGQSFSFTFSATTFTSPFNIYYAAQGLPSWLRFDASGRTLFGTPTYESLGAFSIDVEGRDLEGTTMVHVSLIVLETNTVKASSDRFVEKLEEQPIYSIPNTLLFYPQTYFEFTFGPDIFEGGDGAFEFRATTSNHATLPAWIRFNEETVSFSGTTPSLLTPQSSPQTFDFLILACKNGAFSLSTVDFRISITNHILTFTHPNQNFSLSAGNDILIPSLLEQLQCDFEPVARAQIVHVSSNKPDWLILEKDDLSLHGIAPVDVDSTFFTIEATDEFNNIATADIHLINSNVDGGEIDKIHLGIVNVTAGENFEYVFNNDDTDTAVDESTIDVELGPARSWLNFTSRDDSIHGVVPSSFEQGTLNITATVRQGGKVIKQEYLTLSLVDSFTGPDNGTLVSPSVPKSSESSISGPHGRVDASWKESLILLIMIPITVLLIMCLIAFFLLRRAIKRQEQNNMTPSQVSEGLHSHSSDDIVVLAESDSGSWSETWQQLPPLAPQIGLPITEHRPSTRRPLIADSVHADDSQFTRSSWEDMLMEVSNLDGDHSMSDMDSRLHTGSRTSQEHNGGFLSYPIPASGYLASQLDAKQDQNRSSNQSFNGRRTAGMGHGTNLQSPNSHEPQMTMRHVPLSPLANSSMLMDRVRNAGGTSELYHHNSDRTPSVAQPANLSKAKATEYMGTSISNTSQHVRHEDEQPVQSNKHMRDLTEIIDTSSSAWEDNEQTTEDSRSLSGNWRARGQSDMTNGLPTGTQPEQNRIKQWVIDSATPTGSISNATSTRSQQSDPSQSHSLRFI